MEGSRNLQRPDEKRSATAKGGSGSLPESPFCVLVQEPREGEGSLARTLRGGLEVRGVLARHAAACEGGAKAVACRRARVLTAKARSHGESCGVKAWDGIRPVCFEHLEVAVAVESRLCDHGRAV